MSIDPGRLNHRLVIEAPVEAPDGAGGVVRSHADAATIWAELTPLGGRGEVSAETSGAVVSYRILLRAGPGLTTRHRLRAGDRRFTIVSIVAHDDGLVELRADERVD